MYCPPLVDYLSAEPSSIAYRKGHSTEIVLLHIFSDLGWLTPLRKESLLYSLCLTYQLHLIRLTMRFYYSSSRLPSESDTALRWFQSYLRDQNQNCSSRIRVNCLSMRGVWRFSRFDLRVDLIHSLHSWHRQAYFDFWIVSWLLCWWHPTV